MNFESLDAIPAVPPPPPVAERLNAQQTVEHFAQQASNHRGYTNYDYHQSDSLSLLFLFAIVWKFYNGETQTSTMRSIADRAYRRLVEWFPSMREQIPVERPEAVDTQAFTALEGVRR